MSYSFLSLMLFSIIFSQTIKIGDTVFLKQSLVIGKGQSSISVADFNNDKHKDIAVTNLDDESVLIFIGDGSGKLFLSSKLYSGESPTHVTTSDINNDGFIDIIIANHETSYLTFLNGDGKGNFKSSKNSPYTIKVNPHPHMVLLKDINRDNKPDLIVDNRSNNGLLILMGSGYNQFSNNGKTIDVGGDPYRGFEIVDINNDGWLDIITPNSDEIGISINNKSDKLSFVKKQAIKSESPFSVKLTDINSDGLSDLIVASSGNTVSVLLGDGKGNFLNSQKSIYKMASGAKQIATGDINNDGINDILVSCWNKDLIVIWGDKSRPTLHRLNLQEIPNPWGIELQDLNEDGKDDLLISDGSSDLLVILLSTK